MVATSPSMLSHSWSDVYRMVMGFPSALVGIGDERSGADREWQTLAADFGKKARAAHCELGRHIAHRHRRVQRRAETARGDRTDQLVRGLVGKEWRAFADGRAAFRPQPHAPAR